MTEEVYITIEVCLVGKEIELSDKELKARVRRALEWLKAVDVLTLKK